MSHINNLRRRRTATEVQVLMLDAARELFAVKGFHATTREIAERATVTEQLLFNHFTSKQQLFAAAVLQPFEALVEQQLVEWQHVVALGAEPHQMMRVYVEGLWTLVRDNRALFRALSTDPFGAHVTPVLDRLEQLTAEIGRRHSYRYDAHIAVRIVFAAVTALALHEEATAGRSEADIINELVNTFEAGLTRGR
ncbi:TetR/AcrR family transcriptional regulator [Mycolicibacterium sp. CBMA 234]|uniref:TetR/AcrR family transcriptional regulator n=1 Tax=Mycolicibacterium sp. CBMA 234 TaxID=1918495 RepID=UPI0012DF25D4|nr:TetR/AcrR family transcriptional regulator [Mycolicibacterium sp. CBMA 234]